LMSPDCVVHLPGAPAPLVRSTYLQVSAQFAEAFTHSKTTFADQVAEGQIAVTRWLWQFRHTGVFEGISGSNKKISLNGVTINKFAAGRIVEQWVWFDQLTLLQQLGAK